jgi:hypothetical protein
MLGNWEYFWSWPPGGLPIINSTIFNRVRGVTWSIDKDQTWSTIVQQSQNGRVITIPNFKQPLWKFVYRWGYVKNNSADILTGNTYTDLRTLWGQLLALQGQAGNFFYQPDDSSVVLQQLIVDANGNAEVVHNIGGYLESVQALGTIQIFFNGVLQASPTIAPPSTIAPYLGYVVQNIPGSTNVTATFTYFYRCRVSTDELKFSQNDVIIWDFKEFPFEQVRV